MPLLRGAMGLTAISYGDISWSYSKVGKHVTCDVIFAIVRAQPYWKLYPYEVFFNDFFSIIQKW